MIEEYRSVVSSFNIRDCIRRYYLFTKILKVGIYGYKRLFQMASGLFNDYDLMNLMLKPVYPNLFIKLYFKFLIQS